ncbi:MAG: DUF721 domain-containing protein [Puniceicoccales bacterium]|jgi:predicted nucleic acid-binding Zn ribbon protein|nr:DUF721 domain-containing protein [Puniceicoccales bacterium]
MKFSRKVQNLIADFRGLPRDDSPAVLRKERQIGNVFQEILKKYVKTCDAKIGGEIFDQWPRIVGPMFCSISRPHKILANGALIVKVENSVIRQELSFQSDEILQQIRRICPESPIHRIVFSL